MADNYKNINRVGPARSEALHDAGYETYDDLANADPETLSDELNSTPEDTALEIIVQAQNMANLEDADVEENPTTETIEQETADSDETDTGGDSEADTDGEGPPYQVTLTPETELQYDTMFHTLIDARANASRTNRTISELYNEVLDQLRCNGPDGTVEITVDKQELNNLHSSVHQHRMEYQGDNLIEHMEALQAIEEQINDAREEHLF
jgi:hypothetical protein